MTTDGPEYCVKNRSKTKILMSVILAISNRTCCLTCCELVEDNLQAEHKEI